MLGQLPVSRGQILGHPSGKAAVRPSRLQKLQACGAGSISWQGAFAMSHPSSASPKTTHLGCGDSLVSDNKSFVQLGEVRAGDLGCRLPV